MYYYQQYIDYINYRKNAFILTIEKIKDNDNKDLTYNLDQLNILVDELDKIINLLIMNQLESIDLKRSIDEIKDKSLCFKFIHDFDLDDNWRDKNLEIVNESNLEEFKLIKKKLKTKKISIIFLQM